MVTEQYLPIATESLIIGSSIGCDLYLSPKKDKFVLYWKANQILTGEVEKELLRENLSNLFIRVEERKQYLRYVESNVTNIISNQTIPSTKKAKIVYDVASNLMQDVLDEPRAGQNIERAKNWVANAVNYILRDTNSITNLLSIVSYDYYTYTHSINVAIIGLLFARYLSVEVCNFNPLGVGLLLHDVGKTTIDPKILNKQGKLTEEEFEAVKKHPDEGFRLLKEAGEISEESLAVVLQHHENYDCTIRKGYPKGIEGDEISYFGKVAHIIDVYDALTTRRAYAEAKQPFPALKIMKEEMLYHFQKELFIEFIKFLGPSGGLETRKVGSRNEPFYKRTSSGKIKST